MDVLLRHYRREHRPRVDKEDAWFASQPTLTQAIRLAGLAQDCCGRRLPHGNRLQAAKLRQAAAALLDSEAAIAQSRSFDELHTVVSGCLKKVWKDPELFAYDTALRIGSKLGLKPQKVYLHRGTRVGARRLRLDAKSDCLTLTQVPEELRSLEPREIEDFLCIYKDQFRNLGVRKNSEAGPKKHRRC